MLSLLAALAAGCGVKASTAVPELPAATGPPGIVRVALTHFRWPLDPARAEGRDETTLARALYATPLRTDPVTGAVVPGLCTTWHASRDFRDWRFTCRSPHAIAAALRRWLVVRAEVRSDRTKVLVRLPFPWRRFPSVLTAVGAAPRSVPGPFRLVSGSANRVVVRRRGLTVVFSRLAPLAAVHRFRRGLLDEAPVPVGDIVANRTRFGDVVHTRKLLGLDVVVLHGLVKDLRRAYWETADRGDYEQLVSELDGSSAYGVVAGDQTADPARFRAARSTIPTLPRLQVRIGVPADPALEYGAQVLYGAWRDVGLGPQLVRAPGRDGSFLRILAPYRHDEALPVELVLRHGAGSRAGLLRALAAADPQADLRRLDSRWRDSGLVVPIARVVDARLVSPRLEGWREDVLGNVDYAVVRSLASSRRR